MKQLFGFVILVAFFSSCSKNLVPYSGYLQEKHNWNETEIERIQFYTSKDIVLFRDVTDSDTRIINGSIKIQNGRQVEEVVIKSGTPGVAVWQAKDKRYGISFDDSDDQFLTFGPNPEKHKRYYLLANEWRGKNGIVSYQGGQYKTSGNSAEAFLLVDLKKIKNVKVQSHIAKGRTVN